MKIVFTLYFAFFLTIFLFSDDKIYNLLGTYTDYKGTLLSIERNGFSINQDNETPILIGQSSTGEALIGLGGLIYYIKPCYISNESRITLINIWLQRGDNMILAINIFDYDVNKNILTLSLWNIFTSSVTGMISQKFYNDIDIFEKIEWEDVTSITNYINNGGDINAKNKDNQPILQLAIIKNDLDIVRLIIDAKPDISIKDKDNNTLLIIACSIPNINTTIIKYLINAGVNKKATNSEGLTAFQIAKKNKLSDEILNLLK